MLISVLYPFEPTDTTKSECQSDIRTMLTFMAAELLDYPCPIQLRIQVPEGAGRLFHHP